MGCASSSVAVNQANPIRSKIDLALGDINVCIAGRHQVHTQGGDKGYIYSQISSTKSSDLLPKAFVGGALFVETDGVIKVVKYWGITKGKPYIILPCAAVYHKGVNTFGTLVFYTLENMTNPPANVMHILGCKIFHKNTQGAVTKIDTEWSWGVPPGQPVRQHHNGGEFDFNICAYNHQIGSDSFTTICFVIGNSKPNQRILVSKSIDISIVSAQSTPHFHLEQSYAAIGPGKIISSVSPFYPAMMQFVSTCAITGRGKKYIGPGFTLNVVPHNNMQNNARMMYNRTQYRQQNNNYRHYYDSSHPDYHRRYDTTHPYYDPRYDPNSPNYDPKMDPNNPNYDPRYDPNNPNDDPNGPSNETKYDPNDPNQSNNNNNNNNNNNSNTGNMLAAGGVGLAAGVGVGVVAGIIATDPNYDFTDLMNDNTDITPDTLFPTTTTTNDNSGMGEDPSGDNSGGGFVTLDDSNQYGAGSGNEYGGDYTSGGGEYDYTTGGGGGDYGGYDPSTGNYTTSDYTGGGGGGYDAGNAGGGYDYSSGGGYDSGGGGGGGGGYDGGGGGGGGYDGGGGGGGYDSGGGGGGYDGGGGGGGDGGGWGGD